MAANAKKFEAELEAVFQAEEGSNAAELKFISTAFHFLQQKTGFFGRPNATRLVRALLKKHVDRVEAETKAEAEAAAAEEAAAAPKETPVEAAPAEAAPEAPAAGAEEGEEEPKGEAVGPGNGGRTDRYVWTQTLAEVTVQVEVPVTTKGKDVKVEMSPDSLKMTLRGAEAPLLDGALTKPILAVDSTWIIEREGGKAVVSIFLQKQNGMEWWSGVLRGDPEIDVKQVTPESSRLSDLDPSVRGTVEKMMFDQQQKQMNKPTSDEIRKQEVMERFMAQHPELDFSNAKMM